MKVSEIKISYSYNTPVDFAITNSKKAYELIIENWSMDTIQLQEETKVIYLNNAHNILGIHDLSKGGIDNCSIDIRIVLSIALKCLASGIILVHNHPSGKLVASEPDISITKKLKKACELFEITLVDHLIISNISYLSLNDSGFM